MSRSSWKIPFINTIFFSKFIGNLAAFKVWQRNSIVPAFFVNRKFKVHNGIWLLSLTITAGMIGHKFGEFVFTKRMGRTIHLKKKKKKQKK